MRYNLHKLHIPTGKEIVEEVNMEDPVFSFPLYAMEINHWNYLGQREWKYWAVWE